MKQAVLVIDVQQGLIEDKQLFDGEAMIQRINDVTDQARKSSVPVIFIQHESNAGYLEYDTPEWQLAQGLVSKANDLKLRKTTCDSFLRTQLHELLLERHVEQLIVCGMHTEFCVDTTIRRALGLGFSVILVKDAHTSSGNQHLTAQQVIEHHNATLSNISSFGPRVQTVLAHDVQI